MYNQDSIYDSLALIITELEHDIESEKPTRWTDKAISGEEQDLVAMVDHVFYSNERENMPDKKNIDGDVASDDVVAEFN